MHDTYIAADRVLATVLWTAATGLILLDVVTSINTGDVGILLVGGAGTLSVRGEIRRLEGRERRAFDLGRESADVRDMRRDV